MKAKVEITYRAGHFSRTCGRQISGGYVAECMNPEDFGCFQIYSQTMRTKEEACNDIHDQLIAAGATKIEFLD